MTLTPTEQAFLTMAKMAGYDLNIDIDSSGIWVPVFMNHVDDFAKPLKKKLCPEYTELLAKSLVNQWQRFPIVASTFEALTIERPELREHYERAKEAFEVGA